MSKYVQFVVCQLSGNSKKYLFYAPGFSVINKGDEVLVDTDRKEQRATVLAVCALYDDDSDMGRTLRVLAGAEDKPLKRVIGKYQFTKFDYDEDETNE